MGLLKCERCFNNKDCKLKKFVEETIPWVNNILSEKDVDKWDKKHVIARVLRGQEKGSPGFLEDWISKYAITNKEAKRLINEITKKEIITVAFICNRCQCYIGPDSNPEF